MRTGISARWIDLGDDRVSRRQRRVWPPPTLPAPSALTPPSGSWYFGSLRCSGCGTTLGESVPYRQGSTYRPVVRFARGLVRLPPDPTTGQPRFGLPRAALRSRDPLATAWPRRHLAPASPTALRPTASAARYGRGSEGRVELVDAPDARTWNIDFIVYCPACGRRNPVDLQHNGGALQWH